MAPSQSLACIYWVRPKVTLDSLISLPSATHPCTHTHTLRYGLPVNFVSTVVKPNRKSHKKVSDALKDMYGYLDSKFVASEADVSRLYASINTHAHISVYYIYMYYVCSHIFIEAAHWVWLLYCMCRLTFLDLVSPSKTTIPMCSSELTSMY